MYQDVIRPLRIGNVELENNLILAPMAGVTDLPFRLLCKEQGAGLLCMEMVSAKAILYKNRNTEALLTIDSREHPVSLQLFGSEPDIMAGIAHAIEDRPFDILDINMGCPVPKIVNNGEGSALMKNPKLAGEIIEKTVKAVKKPVTVKIRKGFDDEHVNAVEIAHIAQECGAAAVAVHGRTRQQMYSGKADWDIIRQVREAVHIPVIGNGDLRSAQDVADMADQTHCDGFMIARGAQGNPWIFRQILEYFRTGQDGFRTEQEHGGFKTEQEQDGFRTGQEQSEFKTSQNYDGFKTGQEQNGFKTGQESGKPDFEEVAQMILRHARMMVEYKGEYTGIREIRKHAAWYTAGYPNSSKLRGQLNEVETYEQLEALLSE